jgi:hypothetical protein
MTRSGSAQQIIRINCFHRPRQFAKIRIKETAHTKHAPDGCFNASDFRCKEKSSKTDASASTVSAAATDSCESCHAQRFYSRGVWGQGQDWEHWLLMPSSDAGHVIRRVAAAVGLTTDSLGRVMPDSSYRKRCAPSIGSINA